MTGSTRKIVVILAGWALAIAAAACLDSPVAIAVRDSGISDFVRASHRVRPALKAPGEVWFAILIALGLTMWHRLGWRGAVLLLAGATLSGVNGLLKWIAGRTRPFKLYDLDQNARLAPFDLNPFRDGIPGLFHQTNLSFPSGHAAWAFASAAALSILLPRWRWAFYLIAGVVGIERIAENAHWTSDVVCAAALGIGSVGLLRWLWWDAWAGAHGNEGNHGREAVPLAGHTGIQRAGEHPHPSEAG